MKGLIYKDNVTLWQAYSKNVLLILVVYSVLTVAAKMQFFAYATLFFGGLYPISAITLDEAGHWDTYARTLPVSSAQLVGGKYLVGLVWLGGAAVLAVAQLALYALVAPFTADDMATALLSFGLVLLLAMAYFGLTYVLTFKFGATKARTTVMMAFGLAILLLYGGFQLAQRANLPRPAFLDVETLPLPTALAVGAACAALGLLLYALCWLCSIKIYQHKEF